MMENRIGLYIGGTASSAGGYGDLVSINFDITKFGIRDVSYDSAFNSYYYVVEHTQYGIVYSYIYNPNAVYAYGSSRAGRLQMNFFIPRGYKLSDNLSPLDLIHEVRDTFVNLYMNIYAGKCQFKDVTEFSEEPFLEILSRYEIIPSRRYIPMVGSQDARFFLGDEEKLSLLLQDTHYAEFASYKSIKISTSLNGALGPVPVAIPRTVRYAVIINGKQYGAVDSTNSFNMMCTEVGPDAKYYDSVNVKFALSDIAEGRDIAIDNPKAGCAVTRIDEIGERIELSVLFPKKEFKRKLILYLDSFNANKDEIIEELGNCTLCLAEKSKPLAVDLNSLSVSLSFIGKEIDEAWTVRYARPSHKYDFIVDIPKSMAVDCAGSIKIERKFVGIVLDKVPDAFYSNPPKLILNGVEYSFQDVNKSQKLLMARVVNLAKSNVKSLALQKSGYSFDSIIDLPSELDSKGYLHIPFPGFRKVQQGGAVNQERKEFEGNYLTVRNIVKNVTVIVWGQSSMKISMTSDGNKLEIPLLESFKPVKVSFVKKGYRTECTNSIEPPRQGGYSVKMPELCEISFGENALTYLRKVLPVLLIALLLGFGAGLLVQKKIQLLKDSEPERIERQSGDKDKGLFRIFGKNGRNTVYHATNNTDPQTNGQENSDTTCQELITQDVNETEGGVLPDDGNQQGYAGSGTDNAPQNSLIKQAERYKNKIEKADISLAEISNIRSWVTQNETKLSSNENFKIVAEGIAFYETANDIINSLKNGTCCNLTDDVENLIKKTNAPQTLGHYQSLRDQLRALINKIPDIDSPKPGKTTHYLDMLMKDKQILNEVSNINQLSQKRESYLNEHKSVWCKKIDANQ